MLSVNPFCCLLPAYNGVAVSNQREILTVHTNTHTHTHTHTRACVSHIKSMPTNFQGGGFSVSSSQSRSPCFSTHCHTLLDSKFILCLLSSNFQKLLSILTPNDSLASYFMKKIGAEKGTPTIFHQHNATCKFRS